jgi:glycosyltransferase involved in cell wall biosynthesis
MPADGATFLPSGTARDDGPPEFVVAARLTRQKRVDVAIRAMALLPEGASAATLHVAGDGPERAALDSLARSSGLGDRVVFHGMMRPTDLAALLRRARAVVLPSVGEGYGLALVEGALCGAPPIGARSGGIPDVVEDGVTGLLFEPGDAPGLAAALGKLVADPGLARRLGARARVRALEATPGPLADRLAAVYRRLGRP